MKDLLDKKIVVVMGGPSSEAEVSRRTGTAILAALKSLGYDAHGMEFHPATFADDIKEAQADIVFNAMHGSFGEDGKMQAVLELIGIPYTGSGVTASAVTMDKTMAKNIFLGAGISTPRSAIFKKRDYRTEDGEKKIIDRIKKDFSLPVVVKAASQGSSIGVEIVDKAEGLSAALKNAFSYGSKTLVEEFIDGMEITVAVLGDGKTCSAMPIIEITTESGRYDYDSKYKVGASHHIIPARIDEDTAARMRALAEKTFDVCNLRGVARVDMMIDKAGIGYVIDVNTVPGMTETSLVPDAARAMGLEFPQLCEKMLECI